jgi:hypothetical protein
MQCYTLRCSLLLSASETDMLWSGERDDTNGENSTADSF